MFREHWREAGFWRWYWRDRMPAVVKVFVGAIVIVAMLGGGWLAAERLSTASAGSVQAGVLTFETTV
jgi:hypothetical protein